MSTPSDDFGPRLEAYLAGELDEQERKALEAEALADPELGVMLAEAVGLDATLREARVISGRVAAREHRRRRLWPLVISAAAAVLAVVVFWPREDALTISSRQPVLRGVPASAEILAPRGQVVPPVAEFRWRTDPGAVRYRLELRDASGVLRHVALVADTTLVRGEAGFPTVVDSLSGQATWRVVPILASGREGVPTPPAEILIRDRR